MNTQELFDALQANIALTPMEGIVCGNTKEECLLSLESSLNNTLLKALNYESKIKTPNEHSPLLVIGHETDIRATLSLAFSYTPPTNLTKGELHYRLYKDTLKFVMQEPVIEEPEI